MPALTVRPPADVGDPPMHAAVRPPHRHRIDTARRPPGAGRGRCWRSGSQADGRVHHHAPPGRAPPRDGRAPRWRARDSRPAGRGVCGWKNTAPPHRTGAGNDGNPDAERFPPAPRGWPRRRRGDARRRSLVRRRDAGPRAPGAAPPARSAPAVISENASSKPISKMLTTPSACSAAARSLDRVSRKGGSCGRNSWRGCGSKVSTLSTAVGPRAM